MAIQHSGPQLFVQSSSAPSSVKTAPVFRPAEHHQHNVMLTKKSAQQQHLVLSTESRPVTCWDVSETRIQNLPMYFPRDMLQCDFRSKDLPQVLENIALELRKSSIQASLIHEPLSAKLQTCHENVELYLVFFRESSTCTGNEDDGKVSMSVQRHKGDHMVANCVVQRLVNAAKGVSIEDDDGDDVGMDATNNNTINAVLSMERLIERCAAENASGQNNNNGENLHHHHQQQQQQHIFMNQTPDQMTESAVRDVYSWLENRRRLDLRRQALEYLLAMTDLKRTISSQAIAGSLMVLRGKVPLKDASTIESSPEEVDSQARAIQSMLLNVILNRELPGDRATLLEDTARNNRNDRTTDLDLRPYFPDVDNENAKKSTDLPEYYIQYMSELFHLALRILVQSLEVVACFSNSNVEGKDVLKNFGGSITQELLATATEIADGKDMYSTLLGCVGHAESKLANGYLACKALRLIALDHPIIKEQIKVDNNAKQSLAHAYQIGQVRHSLLKDESYRLWETICGRQ